MKRLRVLKLGWEFPPLINGGLGIACLGLSRGLAKRVDLTVVVPKSSPGTGDKLQSLIESGAFCGLGTHFHFSGFLDKVAEKCYLPANRMFRRLVEENDGRFRMALSISCIVIVQMERHRQRRAAGRDSLSLAGLQIRLHRTQEQKAPP